MKIKKYIVPVLAVILVVSIFLASLFLGNPKEATASGFAMGSPVNITVYGVKNGDEICISAMDRVKEIDKNYLSHTLSDSAVFLLNKNGQIECDQWFVEYMTRCMELSAQYDSFTLFSGGFKSLWKVEDGGYIPNPDEIANVLAECQASSLNINGNTITLSGGNLDLGALGKGSACDEAISYLKSQGVENALVTVGGTVGVMGKPNGKDSFGIGVRNPFGSQNDYFAILNLNDCFVSTSGDYEKYFEKDGVRYSHIFDAETGSPVQNDLTSVTVVAESGMLSDFLSTLIYIEGVEKGFEIAKQFNAEIIIIKKDKTVLVSKGLNDKLSIQDESFSVSVIE